MKNIFKKNYLKNFIVCGGIAAILFGVGISASAAQKEVKNGWLCVEAENLEYDSATMKKVENESASNGFALAAKGDSITDATALQNPSFKLDYTAEKSGTHYVWLRAYYEYDGKNDGTNMFTDLEGTGTYVPKSLWFNERKNTFVWFKLGDVQCSEGANQINIKYRMNNVLFDKIAVTSDKNFNPSVSPQMGTHPRLFVTESDIPALKEKVHNKNIELGYEMIKALAKRNVNFKLPAGNSDFSDYSQYDDIIIAKAFMYLIGEADSSVASEAVKNIRDFLDSVTFDKSDSTYASRYMGETMLAAACVYDWCYDSLTNEDKESILESCIGLASLTEVGFPPVKRGFVTSHGVEDLIYLHQLSISIAVYDEYPDWFSSVSDVIMTNTVPAKKFLNSSGNTFSSWAYGHARNNGAVHAEKMFNALGLDNGISMFGEKYPDFYYMYIYGRLPNGIYFKEGDDYFWNRYKMNNRNTFMGNLFRYMGGTYSDPILQQQGALDLAWINGNLSPLDIILSNFEVSKKDPTELPLTRFTTYPMSSMIARTSWHDGLSAPTAMAYVNMRDITVGDHQHRDIGAFQFYYKGMLAMDSGFYEYSDHFGNYQERSVAHNTVLVDDPNEPPYEDYVKDGGQFSWRQYGETKLYEDIFKETKISALSKAKYAGPNDYAPEFSYISSDISASYTDKVEEFERSCVFINLEDENYPAAMIVYDSLKSKNADFKKTWLLHSEEEPQVDSATNTTTIKRTKDGYNGKLVNKTLIPAVDESEITTVGGDGKEFFVNGKNYPATIPDGVSADAGNWRIELSPKAASQEDVFLNVMYVCDADSNLPALTASKADGSCYTAALIKDNMVTFSKTRNNISTSFEMTVPDNGYESVKVLMTDMAQGKWKIQGNGKEIIKESKNGEFCISFKIPAGSYTVSPATQTETVTTESAKTVTKDVFGDFYIRENENLMYLAKPTKLIDGVPYVAIDGIFTQIGETNILEKDSKSIKLENYGHKAEITVGESRYKLNNESLTLKHPVKSIDGTFYATLEGFEKFLNIKNISYSDYANLLEFDFTVPDPIPILSSLEDALFTTSDEATIEVYIPDNCTGASVSVGNKGKEKEIKSTGVLKVKVPLEDCAGEKVPVVLKYTEDGVEKSVSTVIGKILDAGYVKKAGFTGFENATVKDSDKNTIASSDNINYIIGPIGTDSKASIEEFSKGNYAWKCRFNTINGGGQTNFLYYPNPKLGSGYYADIDFDVYAEKKNYRLTAFVNGENNYPDQGAWLEYTPDISNNNWHSIKYRVLPEENIICVYADGIYIDKMQVTSLVGFSQIGVGVRIGYANTAEAEAGDVYIDNIAISVGTAKCKDFTVQIKEDGKTVKASFTGGSNKEGQEIGKLAVGAFDNSLKLVAYGEKTLKATKNMIDTYTFEETFNVPFVFAKAFLWSTDGKLIPLTESVSTQSESSN